ncbi:unnamed protein product [Closterium sp. NIES-64]|nr:unnamed protein product [Closterium sp. NIES-64]
MQLPEFIQRHGAKDKREMKAEGVDRDGSLVTFEFTLHERPLPGHETDGDVTACVKLSIKYVRAMNAELEWRMRDLELLEGSKLFRTASYVFDDTKRLETFKKWLGQLHKLYHHKLPAVVLMLAGAAGEAVSGGTQPGRGTLVRGERSFERSGQQEGGNAGEEAVEEDARAWSRQQVVRRTLRAGNGERGETWRSGESVEGPPVIATNSTSLSYPAHPYHLSHPPRLSHSSHLSRLSHLSYPSDGAVAWSEVTPDAPVVAPPPLPSDGAETSSPPHSPIIPLFSSPHIPMQLSAHISTSPRSLISTSAHPHVRPSPCAPIPMSAHPHVRPSPCAPIPMCSPPHVLPDGSAMAAVALGTYIYDYLFPITSSNIPMRPFEVFPHSMPSSASLVQFHIALFLLLLSLFLLSLFLLSFPPLFFPPLFFPPIPSPPIPTKAHPFNGMWDPSLLSHPLLSPARALPLCKSL